MVVSVPTRTAVEKGTLTPIRHSPLPPFAAARERGRAFLAVLIALAIAAFLSRDALIGYFGTATRAGATSEGRLPPAARSPIDPTQATPAPSSPVERARGAEETVRQGYESRRDRADGAAR